MSVLTLLARSYSELFVNSIIVKLQSLLQEVAACGFFCHFALLPSLK